MQLHYYSISEPGLPGPKWQYLYNAYWAAYKTWLDANGFASLSDLKTSYAALKNYMPEMLPTYNRLCELAKADEVAQRFFTGFQPPAYINACSQAVLMEGEIQLVRNYDFHPELTDGALLLSAWNGKKVIANSDSLSGVLDGMNEDGLAISLTFGGRKVVGKGFGIPFILRYVLEFCSDVKDAVVVLTSIPSHMSYNVTVLDRSGAFKTIYLAPDRAPVITDTPYSTNHQGVVEWPENAAFNKTLERSTFLENLLSEKELNSDKMLNAFLQPPLYNTQFSEALGTLYTVVYRPLEGKVQLLWPNENMQQSFDNFSEEYKAIKLKPSGLVAFPIIK
jgi:predicted choloylglycine hydrolase